MKTTKAPRRTGFQTESEAWEAVADGLEMVKSLLEICDIATSGLCGLLRCLWQEDRLLSDSLFYRMRTRVDQALESGKGMNFFLLATAYEVAPRIVFARQFAAEARAEGR